MSVLAPEYGPYNSQSPPSLHLAVVYFPASYRGGKPWVDNDSSIRSWKINKKRISCQRHVPIIKELSRPWTQFICRAEESLNSWNEIQQHIGRAAKRSLHFNKKIKLPNDVNSFKEKKKNSNWLEIVSKKVKSLLAAFNGLVETTHNYPRPPDPFKYCPSSKSKSVDHRWKIAIAQCARLSWRLMQLFITSPTKHTDTFHQPAEPGTGYTMSAEPSAKPVEWKECFFSLFYKFRQRRFRDGHKFHPSPAEPGTGDEKRVFFDRLKS